MKKFLISKFDFTQLQKILGTSLCSLMGLSVRRNRFEDGLWQETEAKPCKQSAITWLGLPPTIAIDKEVLCVKIDPDIALFSFSAESVEIMVRSKPLHPTTYELKDHGYMYLNFNDDFISMSSQNTLWVPVESIMAADILVFGQYREILTTADPCGSISVDLCRLKCRMSYLMKFCNCKPLSYHAFWELSNSPVCGHHVEILQNQSLLGINPECLIVHRDTRPDKNCSLKCKKPCNYQVLLYLTYNDKSTKKKYKIVNSTTVISLSVDPFTFPLFEEFPLMTYKQFIAAIGGNLSFYLGISFIALIHIAVFLSQMCYGNGWKNSADSTSFPIE